MKHLSIIPQTRSKTLINILTLAIFPLSRVIALERRWNHAPRFASLARCVANVVAHRRIPRMPCSEE